MITRNITTAENFNFQTPTTKVINTSGYKSAKIVFNTTAVSGNYGSGNMIIKDAFGKVLKMYGENYDAENYIVSASKLQSLKEEFTVDLSKTDSIEVTVTNSSYFIDNGTAKIIFSYDEFVPVEKSAVVFRRSETENIVKVFDVNGKFTTIDVDLPEGAPFIFTIYVKARLKGEATFSSVPYYANMIRNGSGFIQTTEDVKMWINSALYDAIQIEVESDYRDKSLISFDVKSVNSFTRKVIMPLNYSFTDLGAFRFAKVTFENYYNSINSYSIDFNGFPRPVLRDLSGKLLNSSQREDLTFNDASFVFKPSGERVGGGFVLDYGSEIELNSVSFQAEAAKIIDSGTATNQGFIYLELFSDEIEFDKSNLEVIKERKNYDIVAVNIDEKIVDAFGEDLLCELSANSYRYYRLGTDAWYYDIPFNATYIPSLLSGETVKMARIIKGGGGINISFNRICFFTNKNRILYNYIKPSFINYFREAPVYNSEKEFHAVDSKAEASATAKYLPIFPDYNYDQFAGRISPAGSDTLDVFGKALPKLVSANGFLLEDYRTDNVFNFLSNSDFVNSKFYGAVWGTYNLINGDPCVLASADGTEWTVVKWFASVSDYDMNQLTTLKVDLSPIITNAGGYTSGSLRVKHRKYNVPNDIDKEPDTPFVLGGSALITAISVSGNETTITVNDETLLIPDVDTMYHFNNLAPIVYFENVSASSEYDYITNSIDANGVGNTGVFFRLQRVAPNQFKVFGNVGNPYEGRNVCRHFHSVSEYQSGFILTTGENYRDRIDVEVFEGGFIYMLEANNRNNATSHNYTHLNIKSQYFYNEPVRLTSSKNGVNRAAGAFLMSDKDNTLLYVSDSLSNTRTVQIEGRSEIKTTTHGVYTVSLKDIDNINAVQCVAEIYNTAIGLTENNGRFAITQFGGNAIFSSDFGKTWHEENLPLIQKGLKVPNNLFGGALTGILSDGSFVFLNTIIDFK